MNFLGIKKGAYIICATTHTKTMYFNYHATVKKLIEKGKLVGYYFTENHNGIKPALVLVFNDIKRPLIPIRKERWNEYLHLIKTTL